MLRMPRRPGGRSGERPPGRKDHSTCWSRKIVHRREALWPVPRVRPGGAPPTRRPAAVENDHEQRLDNEFVSAEDISILSDRLDVG